MNRFCRDAIFQLKLWKTVKFKSSRCDRIHPNEMSWRNVSSYNSKYDGELLLSKATSNPAGYIRTPTSVTVTKILEWSWMAEMRTREQIDAVRKGFCSGPGAPHAVRCLLRHVQGHREQRPRSDTRKIRRRPSHLKRSQNSIRAR